VPSASAGRPTREAPPQLYRDDVGARRIDPARLDQLLAALLVVLAEVQVVVGEGDLTHKLVMGPACAVVTGSIAVRRRWPVAAGIVVQGLLVACQPFVTLPAGPVTIGWFCALYALAVWTSPRWFVVGLVFFTVSDIAPVLIGGHAGTGDVVWPFTLGAVVVMVLARRIVGDREHRLRIAERERDVAAREAVIEERTRIARELHDVIAHHVSMRVVQAGAERRVLGGERDSTRDVLGLIENIGRDALTEMRRLVGMLRSDQGGGLLPQPGIDDIPALVAQMREAGLTVDLRVDGERSDLPVGIDLSAYRIVQEGLTNALKHAGTATPAVVRLRYEPDALQIEISDRGSGRVSEPSGGGHGLVGIRERVAMYGGAFESGRRAEGGFAIRVLLPVR
jgi:signal transduction histidine kinase